MYAGILAKCRRISLEASKQTRKYLNVANDEFRFAHDVTGRFPLSLQWSRIIYMGTNYNTNYRFRPVSHGGKCEIV